MERHSDHISMVRAGASQEGGYQVVGKMLTDLAGECFVRGKTCLFLKETRYEESSRVSLYLEHTEKPFPFEGTSHPTL